MWECREVDVYIATRACIDRGLSMQYYVDVEAVFSLCVRVRERDTA
jgi:hypothetical protein